MKIYGIEITPEDIHALLDFIQRHRNSKKDEICLKLEFTLSNIEGWYLHYIRVFSPEITRQISGKSFEETGQITNEITKFIYRNEAIQASHDSQDYLREIERDCTSNRLKRSFLEKIGLKRSLVEKIDLKTLRNLDEKIMLFRSEAGTKEEWMEKSINTKRWDVSADEIRETIKNLRRYVEEIRELVRSLQRNLECNSDNIKKFYQQLRN